MPLMNQTEYGRHLGVSRQRVARYIETGQISPAALVKRGRRTLINSDVADSDLRKSLDPGQQIKAKPKKHIDHDRRAAVQDLCDRLSFALAEMQAFADLCKEPFKTAITGHVNAMIAFFQPTE